MNVGLLGCGTIGGGVLELLDSRDDVKVLKVLVFVGQSMCSLVHYFLSLTTHWFYLCDTTTA